MKPYKRALVAFIVSSILISSIAGTATAEQKRVLFYEKNSKYKIEKDYITFKEALEQPPYGFIVESFQDDLSVEVLETRNPDVLIIASLSKSLEADELAAVFEFVMQGGGGLFILGGSTGRGSSPANQITIPFGMTLDDAILEDEENIVSLGAKTGTNKEEFVVQSFTEETTVKNSRKGVSSLAFFQGPGIIIPESADPELVIPVALGSTTAYSPKSQVFQKGSRPPIAAAAIVGEGLVFVLSDEDMLIDKSLDPAKYNYDNLKFGLSIVNWLYSTELPREVEKTVSILNVNLGQCISETEQLNNTLQETEANLAQMTTARNKLAVDYQAATERLAELEAQTDPFFGIQYMYWGIGILGVAVLVLSIIVAGKKKGPKVVEEKEGEVFGYEFEEGFEDEEATEGEEEEDVEFVDEEKEQPPA